MGILRDLAGQRFGRLVVLERSGSNKHKRATWKCVCDCGKFRVIEGCSLTSGNTTSCGCYPKEILINRSTRHGLVDTPTHNAWSGMRERCSNSNRPDYGHYGGRGIKVCERYLHSFKAFFEDMGEAPKGMSIDRVDVNGHYSCGRCKECDRNQWQANCRWATQKQQANNRRVNKRHEYNGRNLTLSEWSDLTGLPYGTLSQRLDKLGWSIDKALTTPKRIANNK